MEFIRFMFSSGWNYAGTLVLLLIIGAIIVATVSEIKKPNQQKTKEAEANAEYWKSMAQGYKYATKKQGFKTLNEEKSNGGDIQ